MILKPLARAAALCGLFAVTFSVGPAEAAMPVPQQQKGQELIVQVWGGCGPYGHRGRWGGCRPGGQWSPHPYWGPRPIYRPRPYWGPRPFYGPRVWGPRFY